MDQFAPVMLGIWREACRHIEIGAAVERIAPPLARRLPFDVLLVRSLDLSRPCLETVAAHPAHPESARPASRSELRPGELEPLLEWCRAGEPARGRAAQLAARLPGLLPKWLTGELLAGPLLGEEGPIGALLLAARPSRGLGSEHAALFRALLEPFSVALENDRRLRELAALREAAEADRLSLLSRLGRTEAGETIVGAESGLRPAMERVDLVAALDVPVLILGETGSGKEVVARAIHARSRRSEGPFLRVNCGAIPTGLIDSELFGHERGSFTGASRERRGWFERADRGTLFLDEVGELPAEAQVRLLRVLQDGTLERVGGERQLHVDVRIVAATHRDLHALIAGGAFREDLWYRIAVFPIHLSPLRDRVEDIPALATHFALRAARRFGTTPLAPSPEDVDLLVRYPWPGNVRELTAVLERAVILGDGRSLEVARALGPLPEPPAQAAPARALEFDERGAAPPRALRRPAPPEPAAAAGGAATLDDAMVRHIEAALARTRGRIEGPFGAALLLDINPHTLRARMRRLGIDWRRFRVGAPPR